MRPRRTVASIRAGGPASAGAELPDLLWLYQMGVVLFWVHDRSPGARRTYALIDRTVPLVVRAVGLARYRLLRGLVTDLLELLRDLRDDPPGSAVPTPRSGV